MDTQFILKKSIIYSLYISKYYFFNFISDNREILVFSFTWRVITSFVWTCHTVIRIFTTYSLIIHLLCEMGGISSTANNFPMHFPFEIDGSNNSKKEETAQERVKWTWQMEDWMAAWNMFWLFFLHLNSNGNRNRENCDHITTHDHDHVIN